MEEPLFAALIEWTSTSYNSLRKHGWTVTLEEFESAELITLELENRTHLGRFALQDIGRVEIGVRDKRTPTPLRGECEVYTREQLKDAIRQFMEWLEQDEGQIQKTPRITCPHGKMGYETRSQARKTLAQITARRGMKAALNEYKCHVCDEWHIGGVSGRISVRRRSFPQT